MRKPFGLFLGAYGLPIREAKLGNHHWLGRIESRVLRHTKIQGRRFFQLTHAAANGAVGLSRAHPHGRDDPCRHHGCNPGRAGPAGVAGEIHHGRSVGTNGDDTAELRGPSRGHVGRYRCLPIRLRMLEFSQERSAIAFRDDTVLSQPGDKGFRSSAHGCSCSARWWADEPGGATV